MTQPLSFLEDPDDTREEIMKATYVALCEHGYSDLTIQRIGDEFSKSRSLLYHPYDSTDELLLDFLEFMLDRLEEQLPTYRKGGADDHIEEVVDRTVTFDDPEENTDFTQALVELRVRRLTTRTFGSISLAATSSSETRRSRDPLRVSNRASFRRPIRRKRQHSSRSCSSER